MTILAAIVVLGILIFVHELGHFLVAKRSGVGVLKFSLGFGPKLVGVKRGETEYLLSALPLGGYVKMIGEDPGDESPEAADAERSFSRKSVGTRARIILAGPLANLLLPVVIFWGVFAIVGQPYFLPVVGTPEAGSPAAQAGLLPGDRVQALEGVRIERWTEIETALQASSGRPLTLTVIRDGRTFDARLAPRAVSTRDIFGQETQVWDLGLHPLLSTRIGQVLPGHVAEQAGLRSGDRILALSGLSVAEWEQLAKTIHASPGKPVRLTVERDGQRFDVTVTPRPTRQRGPGGDEEIGLIGIGPAPESHSQRLNPLAALAAGVKKTTELSVLIVQGFVKLIQAKISPKTIGGPILIAQMAGEVVQRGPVEFLSFTALLSINLAILNLLPIPVLDGGHLLFSLIEWLRGKPVSLRKREIAQQVGMVLLVGLMIFAFYNDIFRWLARP
ncbi:MAG: RIP metalloprotease RseP [candidate division NC10 bacterium]|nr:RIP metalloprotease RseP [candidate division NC10 bacterium]MBI4839865.1 RIP metalloprotease RseP [candidate division NC10 bacterium]